MPMMIWSPVHTTSSSARPAGLGQTQGRYRPARKRRYSRSHPRSAAAISADEGAADSCGRRVTA